MFGVGADGVGYYIVLDMYDTTKPNAIRYEMYLSIYRQPIYIRMYMYTCK